MIKILIADDHAIVREGLKRIVEKDPVMVVAGEATTGQGVLDKVRSENWDLVLLDITMPGRSGLEILKRLRSEYPKLPVLILSIHPEEHYAVRALRAGASGYLTKDSAPDQLISAIYTVSRGRKYVSPSLAEELASDLGVDSNKPPHKDLSDREYQVLCMIASGKRVKEIAEELALSLQTISTYRARILEKMKMKSNAELTHYAIRNRLVD